MAACNRFPETDHCDKGLLISSPQGHSGKTLVSIGLCDIFSRRGLKVQPFKKGPDYIDPSWLGAAADRPCRNLDLFLIPEPELIHSYQRIMKEADFAVVEGAMGLFDGFESPESGTTAEIARLFHLPVVLVVNTTRMTGSIAPMVRGYQNFQEDVRVAAVILNRVSGVRHEQKLKAAVEKYCEIPVVGSIPRDPDFRMEERHLGLIPSNELKEAESVIGRIGRKLENCLDLDAILSIAGRDNSSSHLLRKKGYAAMSLRGSENTEAISPGLENRENTTPSCRNAALRRAGTLPPVARNGKTGVTTESLGEKGAAKVRIGVMYDRVFHFYYPENFEALKAAGAELVYINSLRDRLPEIDGLYIGGGFPELFLQVLEENRLLRREIKEAVEEGLPVYAECAGLMYLCQAMEGKDRPYEMVGVLPARVKMSERPQGHGYVVAEVTGENPFFPAGTALRGHEFHHSRLYPAGELEYAYRIRRGHGIQGRSDGIVYKNLLASYVHLHALGTPEWAPAFVSMASKAKGAESRAFG